MPRVSAYKGTWEENKRPYVVLAPDAYIAIQGTTFIKTCGECNRTININKYVTGINTEASVDSPPGSASINLSIPDTDVNDLYVEGNFVLIPMMEIEIFAKGYYTVGGIPQYYRIFWGMIISISKSWSNGVTNFSISCRDILHWWEKTNVIINPAFVGNEGASCGYQLFGNQFAGHNPYTIIINLAKESMGDFSITDGSFMSFKPEAGENEKAFIGQYAKDVMAYWQLKFGNIWNSLVLYGTSGSAYTFEGAGMDISSIRMASSLFTNEASTLSLNEQTNNFKIQPHEIAAFKVDISRAADVQFFQNDTQSKLSVALTARDQIQYEFYCDTTGDIVFKPPFYNLNVIPNKPVSWINDFEIIDDSINDSEQEVVTHMTSSGNAFGGVIDYGLTDDITVPRTGVIDWHLLKRYGWRRQDLQCEWAGDPKKLFWHLLDYMDRINAKRHNGQVTIPMRPEIRMGFPVWIPFYDSFYYVNAVSHNYSPGGQATTTLTLSAKRSKFIAPKNLGRIKRVPEKPKEAASPNSNQNPNSKSQDSKQSKVTETSQQSTGRKHYSYEISFDGSVGQTAGIGDSESNPNDPLIIRDPNTGKILGYPNVVMVYRTTYDGTSLAKQVKSRGKAAGNVKNNNNKQDVPSQYRWDQVVGSLYKQLQDDRKTAVISRIRHNRYEAGMSNAGLYDYAEDISGDFKEMSLIPVKSVLWGVGTGNPADTTGALAKNVPAPDGKGKSAEPGGKTKNKVVDESAEFQKDRNKILQEQIDEVNKKIFGEKNKGKTSGGLTALKNEKEKELNLAKKDFQETVKRNHKNKPGGKVTPEEYSPEEISKKNLVETLQSEYNAIISQINELRDEISKLSSTKNSFRLANNISVSVRPVSDEFGFEVIGHNRYGRGVFVDRNHVRVNFTTPNTNEMRVQFSASGDFLTNPPLSPKVGLQPDTTPDAFEKMQPEDWITGASSHTKEQVTLTSANTYSSAINHEIEANSQVGAIFIEADATRRAKSIWELQPTIPSGLDEVGFPTCNCKIGRFEWYSLLPKSVLNEILSTSQPGVSGSNVYTFSGYVYVNPLNGKDVGSNDIDATSLKPRLLSEPNSLSLVNASMTSVNEVVKNDLYAIYQLKDANGKVIDTKREKIPNKFASKRQIEVPIQGPATQKPDFFSALNNYLFEVFSANSEENDRRERQYTGLDLNVEVQSTGENDYINPESVMGSGDSSLFNRAALGDPKALEALKNQASWDWTQSEKALDELNQTTKEAEKTINQDWNDIKDSVYETRMKIKNSFNKVGSETGIWGGSTNSQPQPTTVKPLVIDITPTLSQEETIPTNPIKYDSHSGNTFVIPESPKPPEQKKK